MVTGKQFRALALALADASEVPHRDRAAFRTPRRIFATLVADGSSANLKLAPEQQELLVRGRPQAFAPVPGAWGLQGWTTVTLVHVDERDLRAGLEGAHAVAQVTAKKQPRHKP